MRSGANTAFSADFQRQREGPPCGISEAGKQALTVRTWDSSALCSFLFGDGGGGGGVCQG